MHTANWNKHVTNKCKQNSADMFGSQLLFIADETERVVYSVNEGVWWSDGVTTWSLPSWSFQVFFLKYRRQQTHWGRSEFALHYIPEYRLWPLLFGGRCHPPPILPPPPPTSPESPRGHLLPAARGWGGWARPDRRLVALQCGGGN